jgi:hypothetical protein
MTTLFAQARDRLTDRRGVALPIALIGLVAISLLVTTALLTSGTEYAVSRAGGDATTGLYAAETAVQQYLAREVGGYTQGTDTITGTDKKKYNITVNDLGMRRTAAAGGLNFRVFSIGAERSGGGRGVVAMVRVPLELVSFSTTIHAGASLGQNASIGGSIMISDSSSLCNQAGTEWAVQHAQGTTLTISGQAARNIGNDTSTFAGTRTDMANSILNGLNLNDLANNADIKFGRKFTGAPTFSGSPNGSATDPHYDWGCPAEMVSGCAAADTGKYQIIAIDASNSDGTPGAVTINGDYGQGLLVILNGDLRLQGNFVFKGIVLVEGSTDIHGGGGGSGGSKIEGALLGFGNLNICANSADTCLDTGTSMTDNGNTSISSGTVIDYNRCAITAVENAINLDRAIQKPPTRPSFAWFEVVR